MYSSFGINEAKFDLKFEHCLVSDKAAYNFNQSYNAVKCGYCPM